MKLDPTKMKDWEIAEAAEETLRPAAELAAELGLESGEWTPYGDVLAKVDVTKVLKRLGEKKRAKYIDVTAITPTALGEGKTTTTLGLVEGLGRLGKKVIGCVRQPSGGPTFNIKGSAAGGGLAQVVPLTNLSLGLTGDIDAITNANNLAMVALNSRMQHERNHDDAWLAARGLKRLDIDPERVQLRWAIDFCAQGLRNVEIGLGGGALDGFQMKSGFYITVASEVMAILAMSADLADLRGLREGRQARHDRRPRGGRRDVRAPRERNQAHAHAVRRGTARVRACGPVREHRDRTEQRSGRPPRLRARRLRRHGERIRQRHGLREVLEHQVPLFGPQA